MSDRMTADERAELAWLAYRDQYQRERPWADHRRQMRKRDFIAGFRAALNGTATEGSDEG